MAVQVLNSLRAQARTSGSPASYTVSAGINRYLRVALHWETDVQGVSPTLTYGGQSMTKLLERVAVGTSPARDNGVAIFLLNEAGLRAATSSNFALSWSGTAPTSQTDEVNSFSNVDQTNAVHSYSSTSSIDGTNPLSTTVQVVAGAYAIATAGCNEPTNYTWSLDWAEAYDAQGSNHTSSAATYDGPIGGTTTITAEATHGSSGTTVARNTLAVVVFKPSTFDPGFAYIVGKKMREIFLPRAVAGYIPFEIRSTADPTDTVSGETVAYKTARVMDGSTESAWTFLSAATEFGGGGGIYRQPITDSEADHDRGFLTVQTTNGVEETIIVNFTLPSVQDLRPDFGVLLTGNIATVTSQTQITPDSGPAVDNVFNGDRIVFYDAAWNPVRKGRIKSYAGATNKRITLYSGTGQTLTTSHKFKIFDSTLVGAALIDEMSALLTVVTGSSTTSFTATATDLSGNALTDGNTQDGTFKNKGLIVLSTVGGSATGKRDIAEVSASSYDLGNSRWNFTLKSTNPLLGIPAAGDLMLSTPL